MTVKPFLFEKQRPTDAKTGSSLFCTAGMRMRRHGHAMATTFTAHACGWSWQRAASPAAAAAGLAAAGLVADSAVATVDPLPHTAAGMALLQMQ